MNGCLKTSIRSAPNKLTFLTCPITYPLTSIVVLKIEIQIYYIRNFPCLGMHEPRAGRYIVCDIHIVSLGLAEVVELLFYTRMESR